MEKNNQYLGTEPLGKLLFKLAVPSVVAQIINMLYNIVDRIYIGHMPEGGSLALTGLGVCMPIIMVVSAFAALVSMGGTPRASIAMGRGDNGGAERILGNCFILQIIISAILTSALLIWDRDLLLAFGASPDTIGFAAGYMDIYALGTIFVQLTLGMNAFITAQGFSKTGMYTVLIGAVSNIILDPVFIFGLDMGVRGAAIATVTSQLISAVWVLGFLCGKKTKLRLRLSFMRPRWSLIGPVLALGLSPFIMNSTESLVGIVINTTLASVSPDGATADLYIGAYAIIGSVMQMVMMPLTGLSQGAQPIISYNYGAARFDRVKKAYRYFLGSAVVFAAVVWAAVMLFPALFIRLFSSNAALSATAVRFIRVYLLMIVLMAVQIACQQTFVALGNAKTSLFLAVLRKIILLIPLIFILNALLGLDGVIYAQPAADYLSILVGIMICVHLFRSMEHRESEN